jgi:hypothetical protein
MSLERKPIRHISEKPKKCAVRTCRAPFVPKQPFQTWCSPECGLQIAKTKQERLRKSIKQCERREIRLRKQKLKSRAEYLREAQTAFNAFIRERDRELPCISCGRYHDGQYHAGHYRTVGANPELRFEPLNAHKQCAPCNNHKSGDIVNYRINLVRRIGAEKVEWLEGPHEPKRLQIEELQMIKSQYRALLREINNSTISGGGND